MVNSVVAIADAPAPMATTATFDLAFEPPERPQRPREEGQQHQDQHQVLGKHQRGGRDLGGQ